MSFTFGSLYYEPLDLYGRLNFDFECKQDEFRY